LKTSATFSSAGTLAYISLHLLRFAGEGVLGIIDRICSGLALLVALCLMLLNLVDGYLGIKKVQGRMVSLAVTLLYAVLSIYIVLAMTTTKMHPKKTADKSSSIPFMIFK
jgi:hypothetical protein